MEEVTTKQKIINESLKLFAEKGYDGVSMREIAAAVGIKGASIYNHFKGKEDVFMAIFEKMTKLYDGAALSLDLAERPENLASGMFASISEKQLQDMAVYLFSLFARNEFMVMFRKLLVSEQHKFPMAAKCLREYYFEAPVKFQFMIFEELKKQGAFKEYDADIMALHFYSPIYYLLNKADLGEDYETCLTKIKKHVHNFYIAYK